MGADGAWSNQIVSELIAAGPSAGVLIYSPSAGLGNLIGSWQSVAGVDQFGNAFPAGLNVVGGSISGASYSGTSMSLNPGPYLLYGTPTQVVVLNPAGPTFTGPAGVTSMLVEGWGAGGGGGSGGTAGDGGGGGGEYASQVLPFTAGNAYALTIAPSAAGGANGAATTMASDGATLTANGGSHGGSAGNQAGGGGGHGSPNTTHFNGGAGGTGFPQLPSGGGGGGSSGGTASAGNAGGAGGTPGGGAGGLAVPGGGAGGPGGAAGSIGSAGFAPGGGGGGGGGGVHGGGASGAGQLRLTYTPAGGVSQLLASLASTAGTDPATGTAYGQGMFLGANMPLLFQTGATPAAPSSGAELYSLGGVIRQIKSSGLAGSVPANQADHTSVTVVAAANTRISKAWSIPIGDSQVDATYRLTSWGFGTLGSTLQNLTWGIGLNGAVLRSVVVASPGLVSQSFRWYNVIEFHVLTTGAGGTADCSMSGTWSSAQATTTAAAVGCGSPSAGAEAFNTTAANDIELFVGWAATVGAPTITCIYSMLERLGP
jgi:hypothetical protein